MYYESGYLIEYLMMGTLDYTEHGKYFIQFLFRLFPNSLLVSFLFYSKFLKYKYIFFNKQINIIKLT